MTSRPQGPSDHLDRWPGRSTVCRNAFLANAFKLAMAPSGIVIGEEDDAEPVETVFGWAGTPSPCSDRPTRDMVCVTPQDSSFGAQDILIWRPT